MTNECGTDSNLLYKFNSEESAYGYVFALENLFELKKKWWEKYQCEHK